METPQLVALNLILLILVLVVNMKAHAGTILDAQDAEGVYCVEAWNGKKDDIVITRI